MVYSPNMQWLFIEISGKCNLNCKICPQISRKSEYKKFMEFEIIVDIFDQLDRFGMKPIIDFSVFGEPTMHPRFLDILSEVERRKYKRVNVVTNGIGLTEEIGRAILSNTSINRVGMSIYGWDEMSFDRMTRTKGLYEKVFCNFYNFLRMAADMNITKGNLPHISLSVIPQENDIKAFELWKPFVTEVNNARSRYCGEDWDKLSSNIKRCARIFYMTMSSRQGQIKEYQTIRNEWCKDLFQTMVIFCNGDVAFCCEDCFHEGKVGNISRSNIETIWNSNEINSLRRMYIQGRQEDIAPCRNCDYKVSIDKEMPKTIAKYAEDMNVPKVHELKTLPQYFTPLEKGIKRFEWRKNDRDFRVGDRLLLKEFDNDKGYTGRCLLMKIDYILSDDFEITPGYVVLSISLVDPDLDINSQCLD